MSNNFYWILFLILPHARVLSFPFENRSEVNFGSIRNVYKQPTHHHGSSSSRDAFQGHNEQVISVRITSSVAVARGRPNSSRQISDNPGTQQEPSQNIPSDYFPPRITESVTRRFNDPINFTSSFNRFPLTTVSPASMNENTDYSKGDIPSHLVGANIEYIKQLNAKKETRAMPSLEQVHLYNYNIYNKSNENDDSIAEPSLKSTVGLSAPQNGNVPLARSLLLSSNPKTYSEDRPDKLLYGKLNNTRTTTVSFNVVHEGYKAANYNYDTPSPVQPRLPSPEYYNSLPQIYSEPSRVYSEPAKFYSEPAKVYSEPAKVYSEPSKVYSEPSKFYSPPASLYLPNEQQPWHHTTMSSIPYKITTPPMTTESDIETNTADTLQTTGEYGQEENYEVDESVSVMTNGRAHGVQESSTEKCKHSNCKVGYVVEGSQYKKYRVESKTSEGFIVGEYGVVRNEDGALRGVRYTADSDVSPRLIHDGLMKFLQLQ